MNHHPSNTKIVFGTHTIKPKQRPRVVRGKAFTPKETEQSEQEIGLWYRQHAIMNNIRHKMNGRFKVAIFAPRNAKGDLDNYAKTVLDALNNVAYHDDRQVDYLQISRYDENFFTIAVEGELIDG